MRISNNTLTDSIVRQIQNLGTQQTKLQTQVATGQRIFQAEDDPAAMGRVLDLESEQRKIAQYLRNSGRALEVSQASFSGLQSLKKISDRATEIGTLGSGAISPESSRAYASEIDQLIEQAVQFGNTRFRNDYIFAGTAVDTPPFTVTRGSDGKIASVAYAGNAERSSVQLSENASIDPSTTGATNSGIGDFLNQLVALRNALATGTPSDVSAVQTNLLAKEDLLVNALAEHGGIQTRIEANKAQQTDRADNLEALVSAETDVDLPSTIVKLNQSQTAYQAALQSAGMIMKLSLLDYIR